MFIFYHFFLTAESASDTVKKSIHAVIAAHITITTTGLYDCQAKKSGSTRRLTRETHLANRIERRKGIWERHKQLLERETLEHYLTT